MSDPTAWQGLPGMEWADSTTCEHDDEHVSQDMPGYWTCNNCGLVTTSATLIVDEDGEPILDEDGDRQVTLDWPE